MNKTRVIDYDKLIEKAATAWCGDRGRETFPEDAEYFKNMWRYLPGLKKYVDAELDKDNK